MCPRGGLTVQRTALQLVDPRFRELQLRIERWRTTRPFRTAMPERLWRRAAALARSLGVNPVARALHLDYYSLKRRVDLVAVAKVESRPAFVELPMPMAPASSGKASSFLVRIDRPDGAQLRVRLHTEEAVLRLSGSFLGKSA